MSEKKAVASFAGFGFQQVKDLTAKGLSLEQITQLSEAGFTFEQIEEVADVSRPGGSGADAIAAAIQAANQRNRAERYPQNPDPPMISPFSDPKGEAAVPKPALRFKAVYWAGHKEDPEQLTPRQIDLYNRFTHSMSARGGKWRADLSREGDELLITFPAKSLDDLMGLPSADAICLELLSGAEAVDPLAQAERIAALERKLAELSQ